MNKSESIKELATALAAAQAEIENASKNASEPAFSQPVCGSCRGPEHRPPGTGQDTACRWRSFPALRTASSASKRS